MDFRFAFPVLFLRASMLAVRFITIPSGNDLKAVVDGFLSKWGFPQCVGAIDGSHIPIIAPKENAKDYFNRILYCYTVTFTSIIVIHICIHVKLLTVNT